VPCKSCLSSPDMFLSFLASATKNEEVDRLLGLVDWGRLRARRRSGARLGATPERPHQHARSGATPERPHQRGCRWRTSGV
jgi:hypothetical protein